MRTLYLGKWDKQSSDAPGRQEGIDQVLEVVDREGAVRVSFDYDGRTMHRIAAATMRDRISETRDDLEFWIEHNYGFEIRKKEEH